MTRVDVALLLVAYDGTACVLWDSTWDLCPPEGGKELSEAIRWSPPLPFSR